MKVLVTGSQGFIGKNLCLRLKELGHEVFGFDLNDDLDALRRDVAQCDFIVHLAGINRPLDPREFHDGNVNFTVRLLDIVEQADSKVPILFASSTQAALDNPYGRSKKEAEDYLFEFGKKHGNSLFVTRFYNVFGKWCRPHYNSVVATFCYDIARGEPIQVNEAAPKIDFIYIDDLVRWIVKTINGEIAPSVSEILYAEPHYSKTPKEIAEALYAFKETRKTHMTPDLGDPFLKDLYSTYLSYLPEDEFSYPLDMHIDHRGSFTEILKTLEHGQISVNVGKPGIVKGNHYHHTKNEKYLVVHGTCEIRFRKIGSHDIITYRCSDKKLEVVDIPPGYTHCIENVGKEDSVTLMWANELYDPKNPDTFYCPVEEKQ